jgi:hypothetical protein
VPGLSYQGFFCAAAVIGCKKYKSGRIGYQAFSKQYGLAKMPIVQDHR